MMKKGDMCLCPDNKTLKTSCNGPGCDPNKPKGKYSNFMGTGVGTFKIIWWGLGALMILFVVGKGVKLYKEIKK